MDVMDCYKPREATVAHRFFSTPDWTAPTPPVLGDPALVRLLGGAQLYTWGTQGGPPRQWWVRLSGTARQATVIGPVNARTLLGPSSGLPHAVYTRAEIDLGNDLVLTQDWRGTVLTPPARSLTINMLGLRDAMSARIDGGGELASQGGDDAVTIDQVTALVWEASRNDGAPSMGQGADGAALAGAGPLITSRQSRGRQSVRITDTYETSPFVNLSILWFPLMPWAQRARVWAVRVAGAGMGTVLMQLIAHVQFPTGSVLAQWNPEVDDPPWIEATEAVGIRPVILGGGTWRFRVEQEVYT